MKLLLENWRQYLSEGENTIYYWQTKGAWKGGLGAPVPKAIPRETKIEAIFEEVRKTKFPDRPSRLNCVFLCENLQGWSGKSFCRDRKKDLYGELVETYEVSLQGDYRFHKTDAEYWTEARRRYDENPDEEMVKSWAESYWNPKGSINFGEIMVEPPEAAIIIRKHES